MDYTAGKLEDRRYDANDLEAGLASLPEVAGA